MIFNSISDGSYYLCSWIVCEILKSSNVGDGGGYVRDGKAGHADGEWGSGSDFTGVKLDRMGWKEGPAFVLYVLLEVTGQEIIE